MVLQTEKRYYTPQEYLELEEQAEYKSEYRDGENIPMAGGTTNHNKSNKNLDKTDKFKYYRSIPQFQEYIMIDQYSFSAEQYIKKAEGEWIFKEHDIRLCFPKP